MTLYSLFLCSFFAFANENSSLQDSIRYLNAKDTLAIHIGADNEKYLVHRLKAGQTLFSTAKFYGLSLEELYWLNPGLKDKPAQVGQDMLVSLPNKAIIRYKTRGFIARDHVPLYYTIRKGDTMFRLSKGHFLMPPDTIRKRLAIVNDDLKVGQQLLVGWMSVKGIPLAFREGTGNPMERGNAALGKIYAQEVLTKKEINEQGKAFWQKTNRDDTQLYALHRSAPLNSIMMVRNPMNNSLVYVRVIDRIPDTVYEKEVIIVLSPMAARLLGAQDVRFFARVKYYQ